MLPRYDDFAARALGQEAARAARHGARAQKGELNEVASVQRQLGHLLRVDQLAEGRITALQLRHRRLARDGDCLGYRGELQGEIECEALLHFEHDLASFLRLEAGHRDGHGVAANRQQRHGIAAGDIGHDLADRARAFVPCRHHRSRNPSLRGVNHGAGDRSHRLGKNWRRCQHGHNQDQRRYAKARKSHFSPASDGCVAQRGDVAIREDVRYP